MQSRRATVRPASATLRARLLRALMELGPMHGPVRPQQRGLSRCLEAIDSGEPAVAAALVLREVAR